MPVNKSHLIHNILTRALKNYDEKCFFVFTFNFTVFKCKHFIMYNEREELSQLRFKKNGEGYGCDGF